MDACTQPPPFRGTKSPIDDLINRPKLKTTDTSVARAMGQPSDKKVNGNNEQRKKNDTQPSHERPSSFPATLKRPDPKMTVNGKSISSEQHRTLYDDIKNDRCTRCHQKGHLRRHCPDTTPHKWNNASTHKRRIIGHLSPNGKTRLPRFRQNRRVPKRRVTILRVNRENCSRAREAATHEHG